MCHFKRSIRAFLKSLALVELSEQNWINTVYPWKQQFWAIREMWGNEWEHRVMRCLVSLRYLQWSKFVLLLQGNRKHQSWIRTSGKLWFFSPSVFPESLISASKMNVQQLPLNTLSWQRGLSDSHSIAWVFITFILLFVPFHFLHFLFNFCFCLFTKRCCLLAPPPQPTCKDEMCVL